MERHEQAPTPAAERQLAADLFNRTWALLEKEPRTRAEDDELLHCAHASAYQWMQVGAAANRARSEWQCARVHAVLGHAEAAMRHARRCLELVEASPQEMEDWDLAGAYEALARAHAVAGDAAEARRYLELGRVQAAGIADEHDRANIEADLATIVG